MTSIQGFYIKKRYDKMVNEVTGLLNETTRVKHPSLPFTIKYRIHIAV